MNQKKKEQKFVYIGRKSCGCVAALTTDNGDDFTAESVAEFIADGLTVQRHSWSEYRDIAKEVSFLSCPHGQLSLQLQEVA